MPGIIASVGLGGKNLFADTRTVQELVNQSRQKSGQPPIGVDGFVGPETVGAIKAFQQSHFGWADGRVDPNGPTITALNVEETPGQRRICCGVAELGGGRFAEDGPRFGLVPTAASAATTATKLTTPKDKALSHKTEAVAWIQSAITAIQSVNKLFASQDPADRAKLDTMLEWTALKTHFHVDQHVDKVKFLTALGKTYGLMSTAVSGGDTTFENDLVTDSFAISDPGGFAKRNDQTNPGRMYFCFKYLKVGPLSAVVTILHEAAHYVDKSIDHFASAVPAPNGRALTGSAGEARVHNYADMTPLESQQNAASYAGFAIHCAKKQDLRPTITQ